ncbi:LexA family transcriptional repressor [Vibrio azureus]|uniref:Putative prophage repressor n=1 Tax=Vibrio azureus NBRC 104587 TaxID=1219077 RepID=U3AMI4_9VIBR|nr:S24 family peptidase [Vibrio azureus]AUI88128.1 LexA family transcriptional repressor [Vibrio azureus]GAD74980.1 putative prophage repressor [Vibrio azureus NBRC 104587]
MSFADRVKQRRKELNLSQSELAERVGVAQQSIHKIEDGRTLKPRNILQLASALKCSALWLQGLEPQDDNLAVCNKDHTSPSNTAMVMTSGIRSLPILSQAQAGDWAKVIHDKDQDFDQQITSVKVSEKAFAMRVTGNSMTNPFGYPSIPAGSVIVVEPCSSPDNGKIVVAILNDAPEATIKKLEIDGPQKYLLPLNPKYDPISISGNCRIIGYVKQVVMDI